MRNNFVEKLAKTIIARVQLAAKYSSAKPAKSILKLAPSNVRAVSHCCEAYGVPVRIGVRISVPIGSTIDVLMGVEGHWTDNSCHRTSVWS